jgi:L-asparaginase / beta-aspartyl-peptidase
MTEHRTYPSAKHVIIVHGGAGDVPVDRRPLHIDGCRRAAEAGAAILKSGGSAIDAVEAAVRVLEDDPLFNAGTGACLNEDGLIELDASIMDGATSRAGAVAAMPPFKNAISIARAAMEDGRHVMYAAHGAARFAMSKGFARATVDDLKTEAADQRWREVRDGRAKDKGWAGGTVGAVARDAHGHVAAATSTGGMTDKAAGRVGDSPIIGAGTFADDAHGAASTTGHGEAFIRTVFAARVIEHPDGESAARDLERMTAVTGGRGGVIVVGRDGSAAWARNTETMTYAVAYDDQVESGC